MSFKRYPVGRSGSEPWYKPQNHLYKPPLAFGRRGAFFQIFVFHTRHYPNRYPGVSSGSGPWYRSANAFHFPLWDLGDAEEHDLYPSPVCHCHFGRLRIASLVLFHGRRERHAILAPPIYGSGDQSIEMWVWVCGHGDGLKLAYSTKVHANGRCTKGARTGQNEGKEREPAKLAAQSFFAW